MIIQSIYNNQYIIKTIQYNISLLQYKTMKWKQVFDINAIKCDAITKTQPCNKTQWKHYNSTLIFNKYIYIQYYIKNDSLQ